MSVLSFDAIAEPEETLKVGVPASEVDIAKNAKADTDQKRRRRTGL